ncbi:DNA/RNA polymerases superfamily protein [Gossypium australe]|uniref:DNA/RNA polymerases superfamily protein n=1 Tax=Gossypium australe TaxID=47621 RepID=A0A5B6VMC4_9ROSI|nr:DNA/RNA polymerases superfamily protein [Gossypium australe]
MCFMCQCFDDTDPTLHMSFPRPRLKFKPIQILAREIKELRNKRIKLVKVLWHRNGVEDATWEP